MLAKPNLEEEQNTEGKRNGQTDRQRQIWVFRAEISLEVALAYFTDKPRSQVNSRK